MDDRRFGKGKDDYVSQDTTDYGGVRYTPSVRRAASAPQRRVPAPKQHNSQFAVFFITTVFVGVLVCVIVFAVVFSSIIGERNADARVTPPTTEEATTPTPGTAATRGKELVAMITSVRAADGTLTLFDLEQNELLSVSADAQTALEDQYGGVMVLDEFAEGEIVDVTYNEAERKLTAMRTSSRAWQLVASARVDTAAQTITLSNATYRYTDDTIAKDGDRVFDIATLDPIDIVTVKGYADTAWFISLDKGHGVLHIEERSDIINGTIEVDTLIYEQLDEAKELSLAEGDHHVVIKGDNIAPFSVEVSVVAGETQTLDLTELELKAGLLTVSISEPDAVLLLNGEEIDYTEPLALDYGEYTVEVKKDGFAAYTDTLVFEEPTGRLDVTLEKLVQLSSLTIETEPSGAQVYIDDVYVGVTPVTTTVEYGLKSIAVKKEGYIEINFPVNVVTDAVPLTVTLQEEQSGGPDDLPDEVAEPLPGFPDILY